MRTIISLLLLLFLSACTSATKFGAGVNITFDPRTIGMQIDDTIMQKNLNARLALTDKKYFLTVLVQVPTFFKTIGKSLGPITKIATTTIISSSNHPICGIEFNFY